jgi:hypothetical protein
MEADLNYFRRRAQEEREAAMRAPHPAARQSHIELAERYDELAKAIAERGMELDSRIAG